MPALRDTFVFDVAFGRFSIPDSHLPARGEYFEATKRAAAEIHRLNLERTGNFAPWVKTQSAFFIAGRVVRIWVQVDFSSGAAEVAETEIVKFENILKSFLN